MRRLGIAAIALVAFTIGAVGGALAADYYKVFHRVTVELSQADALTCATWFIGRSAWDQPAADMDKCVCARSDNSSTGFLATCNGKRQKAATAISQGDRILEEVP